ncbi:hypothetical protein ACRAWG_16500 [Methylobacterium sp. P31]
MKRETGDPTVDLRVPSLATGRITCISPQRIDALPDALQAALDRAYAL